MAKGFVYDKRRPPDPAVVRRVQEEIVQERSALERDIRKGPKALEGARKRALAQHDRPVTEDQIEGFRALRQAAIDAGEPPP